VADYLARPAKPAIAGAILTSGIYDLGNTVSVWKDYYGEDVSQYSSRSSLPKLAKVATPLLITSAELDPPTFLADTDKLLAARKASGQPFAEVRLPAHSHISETYAIGTADESLARPVAEFVKAH
jgi:triacylglycerol lipase